LHVSSAVSRNLDIIDKWQHLRVISYPPTRCHQSVGITELDTGTPKSELCKVPWTKDWRKRKQWWGERWEGRNADVFI